MLVVSVLLPRSQLLLLVAGSECVRLVSVSELVSECVRRVSVSELVSESG